jgi:hypothetical protein
LLLLVVVGVVWIEAVVAVQAVSAQAQGFQLLLARLTQ